MKIGYDGSVADLSAVIDWPLDQPPPPLDETRRPTDQEMGRDLYKQSTPQHEYSQRFGDRPGYHDIPHVLYRRAGGLLVARKASIEAIADGLDTAITPDDFSFYLNRLTITRTINKLPMPDGPYDDGLREDIARVFPEATVKFDPEALALRGVVLFGSRYPADAGNAAGLFVAKVGLAKRTNGDSRPKLPLTRQFIELSRTAGVLPVYAAMDEHLAPVLNLAYEDLAEIIVKASAGEDITVNVNKLQAAKTSSLNDYKRMENSIANQDVSVKSKELLPKGLEIFYQVIKLAADMPAINGGKNNAQLLLDSLRINCTDDKAALIPKKIVGLANTIRLKIADKNPRSKLAQAKPLEMELASLPQAIDRLLYAATPHIKEDQRPSFSSAGHCARMLAMMGIDGQTGATQTANMADLRMRYAYTSDDVQTHVLSNVGADLDFDGQMRLHRDLYLVNREQ